MDQRTLEQAIEDVRLSLAEFAIAVSSGDTRQVALAILALQRAYGSYATAINHNVSETMASVSKLILDRLAEIEQRLP